MSDDQKLRELRKQLGVTGKHPHRADTPTPGNGPRAQRSTVGPGAMPPPSKKLTRTRETDSGEAELQAEITTASEITQEVPSDEIAQLKGALKKVSTSSGEPGADGPEGAAIEVVASAEFQLSDDDLVEIDAMPAQSWAPIPPPPTQPAPTVPGRRDETLPPLDWPRSAEIDTAEDGMARAAEEADRTFLLKEAQALAPSQPERAARLRLEAAEVGGLLGLPLETVLAEVEGALELSDDPSVLPHARRLAMRLEAYERALDLAERELSQGGDNANRTAVLIESAAVLQHCSDARGRALEKLEQALQLQPGQTTALCLAAALQLKASEHRRRAQTVHQLVESLSEPNERALLLYELGTIYEYKLEQPNEAAQAYRRCLEADSEHLPAAMSLALLYERGGQWAEIAPALERWAALVDDDLERSRLLLRAGLLHLGRTGQLDGAARCLADAARFNPGARAPLQRLAEVQGATDRAAELVGTLRQLLEQTVGGRTRAALLCRIGWLAQARLEDTDQAVTAYREALTEAPGYLPALQALGTIYRQRGELDALVALHATEVESAASPALRAARCLEMGQLLAERLGRPEEAANAYRRALELQPELQTAFWSLADLLRQQGEHAELAELLHIQAEVTRDEKTRHHLLLELARLQSNVLGSVDEALATLGAARELKQTRSAALEMMRLLERTQRETDHVELLLQEALDTSDRAEAQAMRLEAAQLLDRALDEPDRALEIYRGIYEEDPACVVALRAAGRIYHRLGRWSELVALHRHELRASTEPADTLCRIGRIHDEQLGQTDEAIAAYLEALDHEQDCVPALEALERLLRAAARWDDLVQILQRVAAARTEPVAQADVLCRAAEVAEIELDDLDRAAALYEDASAACHDYTEPLYGVLWVRLRQQNYSAAASALSRCLSQTNDDQAAPVHLQLALTRIEEFRLHRSPNPAAYQQLVEASVLGQRMRAELTRVMRLTNDPSLANWLVQSAGQCRDQALANALLVESAYRMEFGGATGDPREPAEQALALRPQDLTAIWLLDRALHRAGDQNALAALYAHEAELEHLEPAARAQRLHAAARAHLQADASEDAARLAHLALEHDPGALPALRLLCRIAEARGDWPTLATLHDHLASACKHPEDRLSSAMRAAELWSERIGDDKRALQSLQLALADDPGQPDAFDLAEALIRRQGTFELLVPLFERRIRASRDRAEKHELLLRHARLLRDEIGDPQRAVGEFSQALEIVPNDLEALLEQADLQERMQRWSDAAGSYRRLAEIAPDPGLRQRCMLKQAALWLHRLHDPEQARHLLQEILDGSPEDVEAKKLLVELMIGAGEWGPARELLEQVAQADEGGLRAWALAQLAEVARVGLRDQQLRQRYEVEALTEAVAQPKVLSSIAAGYRARREQRRLVQLGEGIIADTSRADVIAPLRLLVAQLLLEGDPDSQAAGRALELLREAMQAQPDQPELQLLFARALAASGDAEAALASFRRVVQQHPAQAEAYRGMVRVASALGRGELAAAAASIVEMLGDADAEERLQARILEQAGSPAGRLDPRNLGLPPELRAVASIVEPAAPHLGSLVPLQPPKPLPDRHPAAIVAQRLADALGLGQVTVAVGSTQPALAAPGQPIVVQLSSTLAEGSQQPGYRFWVGRALCQVATAGALFEFLDDRSLDHLLEALCTTRPNDAEIQQLRKQVTKGLPRKIRKQLEAETLPTTTSKLWQQYRAAEIARADQVGLLLCRSPRVAIEELLRAEGIPIADLALVERGLQLLRFAVSDGFAQAYRQLWTAH